MKPVPRWLAWFGSEARSVRSLAWAGGVFIGVLLALTSYDIVRGYRVTVGEIERELDAQARVIAELTSRSVQAVDGVLRLVADEHRRGRLGQRGSEELHDYLHELAEGVKQIDGLGMFDARGDAMGVSWPAPRLPPNMSQLPRFQALRDDATLGFAIFDAAPGAGDGVWIIPFARRLETRSGAFDGVVAARGRVDYFQQVYRNTFPDPSTRVALLHRERATLLARHPVVTSALGKEVPRLKELLDGVATGRAVARNVSPIDGREQFGTLYPVEGYPLVVAVTRDAQAALQPWRQLAVRGSIRTLGLAALASALLWLALRQIKRVNAARLSLATSQERYALAAAGADDGIWDWDLVAGTAYESARAREIQGLPLGPETQPLHALEQSLRVHPDDEPLRAQTLQTHLEGRTPAYEIEYRVRHGDGEYRWIRVRALCIRDAAGKPLRIAGSVSDVDARKCAEVAQRESEERYALAMRGSRGGHWVWNLDTDAVFLSGATRELFGLPPDQPLGTRAESMQRVQLHPDDRPRFTTLMTELTSGRIARADFEFRIRLPDGSQRWILTRAQRFAKADGSDVRIAGVSVDISDRKDAEAEHEKLEQQLRQAQKLEAIGTLAGGIAHDFNNILSAILGFGELAQRGAPEGSAQRRHLDAALAAAHRAKSLVERILAFSRSGMGERVPVHVQSVVAEALETVAATLPAGVTLERRLAAGDAAVLGDATQIHQVVMNLCANAVQAMRAEGRLVVALDRVSLAAPQAVTTSTLAPGDYLRLSVADTGSGIEPRLLERIFDPFFTTKEIGVGTGLGLSLVHGIVADLGGGIAVDSRLGHGSTFTIHLPAAAAVAAPAAAAAGDDVPQGSGQVVLLVDDEEPLVRLCEEMLAGLGYEPVGFDSSRAALAALRTNPQRFDALLSDESMPGLTGTELAAEARRLRPDLPVVLMTGFVSASLLQQARAAGVAEVLGKPLAAAEIARALAAALPSAPTSTNQTSRVPTP